MASPGQPSEQSAEERPSAADYAARLLSTLPKISSSRAAASARPEPHPALEWARSGAMGLTGDAHAAPRLAPGRLATCCRGAAQAFSALASQPEQSGTMGDLDGPALLGERAALAGLGRRGSTAPGGKCRFVRCADDWLAINLARDDDEASLPAWLAEGGFRAEPGIGLWDRIAEAARGCSADSLISRARLLGLPVARTVDTRDASEKHNPVWCRTTKVAAQSASHRDSAPLVVDLSSLWAGPLCSQLLGAAGARVIKLESRTRPDGARSGPSAFFDLMNADKQSVALDFQNLEDLRALRVLIASADIVVESARPRALRQLGIDALTSIRQSAGQVWLSITGYGRAEPQANWVAFGDDAAVAAGLFLRADDEATPPAFCADAVADPLAGLHAAIAALTCWRAGGGMLLDVALRDVAAHALAFGETPSPALVRPRSSDPENPQDRQDRQDPQDRQAVQSRPPGPWEVLADGESQAVLPPRTRVATGRAPALGADTRAVLQELAPTC